MESSQPGAEKAAVELSSTARTAATGLCLLAVGPLATVTGWGEPTWMALSLLIGAVALAELAPGPLQRERQSWQHPLTEAVLAAALVLSAGAWVVVGVCGGATVAQSVRRRPRNQFRDDILVRFLSVAGAAGVAVHLGGGLRGAVLGLVALWSIPTLFAGLDRRFGGCEEAAPSISRSMPMSALHTAGHYSLGLLGAYLALHAPLGLLALVLPLALLWIAKDERARGGEQARLFTELARGREQVSGRSTDVSAQVVLTTAARLLRGDTAPASPSADAATATADAAPADADAEMLLVAADGAVRYVGDGHGMPQRLRVDPDAFGEPWVLRAVCAGGVSWGVAHGRPWCSAVLAGPQAPLAVLVVRRPPGAAPFGRTEGRLAQLLAAQGEAWLSSPDRSVPHGPTASPDRSAPHGPTAGPVRHAGAAADPLVSRDARSAPALTALRDAAERLTELVARQGGVEPILVELQAVERAAACLLGAVAVEPDPRVPVQRVPALPVRPAAEWTTTGVLA